MNATDAVGSSASARGSGQSAFSELNSGEFLKIIFTELGRQDPLQPSDSKALLEQLSSLRSIQSDVDLSENLRRLMSRSDFAAAAGLTGKSVSGISETNTRVAGVVGAVLRTEDGPVLRLESGERIRFENADEIVDPSVASAGERP